MAFGKVGRPPDDRLARQREIYEAVSPLIFEVGARRLSMREAAYAACLSVGGLYHYFPSKRDLVLHALQPEATARCCQDFHAEFGHLAASDPAQYVEEYFEFAVRQVSFFRPAVHAALELGASSFWEVLETSLSAGFDEYIEVLGRIAPQVSEEQLQLLGRALRRTMVAALLDRSMTPDEFRANLRAVIDGFMAEKSQGQQLTVTGVQPLDAAVALD